MDPHVPRRVALVAVTAAALVLAGCGTGSGSGEGSGSATDAGTPAPSPSASPTPSSTVAVPGTVALTEQGSALSFGDSAEVIFESTENKGTVLRLTVHSVRKGRLRDFEGFVLDDTYKQKAAYYYARVSVRNVGEGDVGGAAVPLWGVNKANTLLPAVNFTTEFTACPSKPLPAEFPPGASLTTCLVYLAPDRGALEAVSYRPSQRFDPITWTGTVQAPAPLPKQAKKTKPGKPAKTQGGR